MRCTPRHPVARDMGAGAALHHVDVVPGVECCPARCPARGRRHRRRRRTDPPGGDDPARSARQARRRQRRARADVGPARGALRLHRRSDRCGARSGRSSSCAPATSWLPSSSSISGTRTERGHRCRSMERSGTDLANAGPAMRTELEAVGYTGVWTAETAHDPFLPLVLAAEHTTDLQLGTSIAVAFARNPMTLANIGWDLQTLLRRPVHARSREPDQAAHHQTLLDGVESPGAADARDGARDPGDLGHVAERHAARSSAASSTRTR